MEWLWWIKGRNHRLYLVLNVMNVMLVVFDAVWQEELVVKEVGRKDLVFLEEFVMKVVNVLGRKVSRMVMLMILMLMLMQLLLI